MMTGNAAGRGDGTFLHPAEVAWARWMGDMPRSDPRVSSAISLLTPQAIRPFVETVDLRVFYGMRVPRTYIRCLQDKAVVPERAAECAARLGVTPVDMDCAHNAMLSQPDELARILENI
jgi:pimeloyl-ACP methyl ester carboxylesterase